MNPKIQVLVPSGWSKTERGTFFENLVAELFRQMQFKVTGQIRVTGMEIDLLAEQLSTKDKAYIECKFITDLFGAPVISKLIGNAIQRDEISIAYLVSTAEPGKDAEEVLRKYEEKDNLIRGVLRFAFIRPPQLIDLFLSVKQYPTLEERLAEIRLKEPVSAATLVITPDEACWVLERQRGGMPYDGFTVSSQ